MMMMLYPRARLDIATKDLLLSARSAARISHKKSAHEIRALENDIGSRALVTLSVRSAWDLILTALDLPSGSEVIMSSVTIPDMARIAEAHGLVVVPIDLDPLSMMPRYDLYCRAFSARTRVVLLAHLLGGSFDIRPFADIAGMYGVPLIEDRAQAFVGPHDWGSSAATASLFSFGSIKTSTALGCAVALVRDPTLLEKMRAVHSEFPVQEPSVFSRKARKYVGVQCFRSRVVYGAVAEVVGATTEHGLDGFISRTVKGFKADTADELLRLLRQRPSGAQVALLRRRLDHFDDAGLHARAERGEMMQRELGIVCDVLGAEQPNRSHWLFAVVVENPGALIMRLRGAGFDATQGATTIGPLAAPGSHREFEPVGIRRAMQRAVFVPAYPQIPERDAIRLIQATLLHQLLRHPPSQATTSCQALRLSQKW